jgi:hypothetical protein
MLMKMADLVAVAVVETMVVAAVAATLVEVLDQTMTVAAVEGALTLLT